MIGRLAIRIAGAALALLIGAGAGAGPAAPPSTLRVVAFNVLAPIWSSPVWHPKDMDKTLLETEYRRARITAFLSRIATDTDIVCLQEVQDSEFPHFMAALGERFIGAMAVNDPTLWANYLADTRWAPNGAAIAIRRSVLDGDPQFRDLPTYGGNHVSVVTARTPRAGDVCEPTLCTSTASAPATAPGNCAPCSPMRALNPGPLT